MSDTSKDCMKEAFAALLRGDTAERDRLCARAKLLIEAEDHAAAVERVLRVDFYGFPSGVLVPTVLMAGAAHVRH